MIDSIQEGAPSQNTIPTTTETTKKKERFFSIKRVKQLARRTTVLMSAAALATACSGSSTYEGKPTATYATHEIAGKPQQYSLPETFNALSQDPNIPKTKAIDITPIAEQFKPTDYINDSHSVPVMEVRFDKATNQFTYQVQTPGGLDNQELYQLLMPVIKNATILQAAFENNDASRLAFRLQSPNPSGVPADWTNNDEYVSNDTSDPKAGKQKTIFLTLPGVRSLDSQEVEDIIRHEAIHGLTGKNNLSDYNKNPADSNSEELAKWNTVCTDMRDVALQDAKQHKQSSIETLKILGNQFDNTGAKEAINEIIDALQHGTFDRFQLQQGGKTDQNTDLFISKIPDCMTIGPWEAFIRLMNNKGLGSFLLNLEVHNNAVSNISQELQVSWDNMVQSQTIYKIFREGPYEKNSPEKLLGHEYYDWDELITSTSDVCIAYPEKVGAMIKNLPPDKRAVALQLVHLSLTTLNEQVPPDKNEDFHKVIFQTLKTVIQQ